MKIILAMSGGVDSSVAAHLLQREGWQVQGTTLDLWREGGGPSPAVEEAAGVAKMLGIPHRIISYRDEFLKEIVQPFCDEYFSGRTPNPCVRCNPLVKFRLLAEIAASENADAIATGHYVRVERLGGRYAIRKAADASKDQSYVLYGLSQEQLALTVFPLGSYRKDDVRALAREIGLLVHDRPDSQEICFLPGNDYGAFLANAAADRIRPGPLVDTSGRVLGQHTGIHQFTIGQRKRLGIALGQPRYVVRIEPDTATVVIGTREETLQSEFTARGVNWVSMSPATETFRAEVKIRYTHTPAACECFPQPNGSLRVRLATPESAVTPGQSAVFYQTDLLLCGGVIQPPEE